MLHEAAARAFPTSTAAREFIRPTEALGRDLLRRSEGRSAAGRRLADRAGAGSVKNLRRPKQLGEAGSGLRIRLTLQRPKNLDRRLTGAGDPTGVRFEP